jgi:hypothetical protein
MYSPFSGNFDTCCWEWVASTRWSQVAEAKLSSHCIKTLTNRTVFSCRGEPAPNKLGECLSLRTPDEFPFVLRGFFLS